MIQFQYVNTGTSPNSHNGDVLRLAFSKINSNFAALNGQTLNYGLANGTYTVVLTATGQLILPQGSTINDTAAGLKITAVNHLTTASNTWIFNGSSGVLTVPGAINSLGNITLTSSANSGNYWITEYGDLVTDTDRVYASSVTYDNYGNVYVVGGDITQGTVNLVKFNPAGQVVWQNSYNNIDGYVKTGDAITVNQTNLYFTISESTGTGTYFVVATDLNGNLQWQTETVTGAVISDIATDCFGNIYVVGSLLSNNSLYLARYTSSGSLYWQQNLSTTSSQYSQYGITTDIQGNVYCTGLVTDTTAGLVQFLAKFGPYGNILWQTGTVDNSVFGPLTGYDIVCDSNNNLYISSSNGSYTGQIVSKYSSTGSLIWSNIMSPPSAGYGWGLGVDSQNNLYASGIMRAGLNTYIAVTKYSSTGSFVFSRLLGSTATNTNAVSQIPNTGPGQGHSVISVFGNSLTVVGVTRVNNTNNTSTVWKNNHYKALISQFPTDGSLIGQYQRFTYTDATLTNVVSSYASNLTVYATTLTVIVTTATLTTSTLFSSPGAFATALTVANGTGTSILSTVGSNTWQFNQNGSTQFPNYTFPATAGTPGQYLYTDGLGNLGWSNSTVNFQNINVDLLPAVDTTYNLGSPSLQWKSLYVSTNTVFIGRVPLTINTATNTISVGTGTSTQNVITSNATGTVQLPGVLAFADGSTQVTAWLGTGTLIANAVNSTYAAYATTATNIINGVSFINGTVNQVYVSANTGSVILTTPQAIATSSNVTFAGINATTVTSRLVTSTSLVVSSTSTFGGPIIFSSANITATGTNQATAAAIVGDNTYIVAGTGGVVLPVPVVGREISITNATASSIYVYPSTGTNIENSAANIPTLLPSYATMAVVAKTTSNWWTVTPVYNASTGITITQSANGTVTWALNTATLMTNAVNATTSSFATTSGYAQSFNTSTLVTNAVSAQIATTASNFNTATLVTNSVNAVNIAGGAAGSIPYQIAGGLTGFISIGSTGTLLQSNGITATWITTSSLGVLGYTGSKGTTGTNGYTGSVGFVGSIGFVGSVGYTGSVGFVGSQGTTGTIGYTGSVGFVGSIGYTGSFGYTGSVGFVGSIGFVGSVGYTGSVGFVGSQGASGTGTGYVGSIGYTGSSGSFTNPFASILTITNVTVTTSTNTGALQVTGGVGVGGGLYVGGTVTSTNHIVIGTGAAASTTTGALQVVGGAGIGGGLYVGGVITATNVYVNGYAVSTGSGSGGFASTSSLIAGTYTVTLSLSNGLLTVPNNIASSANTASIQLQSTYNGTTSSWTFSNNGTTGTITFPDSTVQSTAWNPSSAVVISSTLSSTSTITGALQVVGGVGVGGGLYVGGVITATNVYVNGYAVSTGTFNTATLVAIAVSATSITANTAITVYALTVTNTATLNGPLIFSSANITATGTNQATAALITADNTYVTTGTGGIILPTAVVGREISITNATAGSVNVYPAVGASIENSPVNTATSLPSYATLAIVAKTTSNWWTVTPVYSSSTGITITQSANGTVTWALNTASVTLQAVTGYGSSTNNAITISNTTNSTSTTTGALIVTGGHSVGSNMYVGGILNVVNYQSNTTSSQGALNVGNYVNSYTGQIATFAGSDTTYSNITLINNNSTNTAYASYEVANNGFNNYMEMGVNSTNYSYSAAGYANNSFSLPGASFLESVGSDLTIGTYNNNNVHFVLNANSSTSDILLLSTSTTAAVQILSTLTSISSTTGALTVAGGVGIGNGLYVVGTVTSTNHVINGTSATTSTTTGALTVAGGAGIGGGLVVGGVITATNVYVNGYAVSTSTGGSTFGPLTGDVTTPTAGSNTTTVTQISGGLTKFSNSLVDTYTFNNQPQITFASVSGTNVTLSSTAYPTGWSYTSGQYNVVFANPNTSSTYYKMTLTNASSTATLNYAVPGMTTATVGYLFGSAISGPSSVDNYIPVSGSSTATGANCMIWDIKSSFANVTIQGIAPPPTNSSFLVINNYSSGYTINLARISPTYGATINSGTPNGVTILAGGSAFLVYDYNQNLNGPGWILISAQNYQLSNSVSIYNTPGTYNYNWPATWNGGRVIMCGGGGGGGSGAKWSTTATVYGGNGGNSACWSMLDLGVSNSNQTTATIIVGYGGPGATQVSGVSSGTGYTGSVGGDSSFSWQGITILAAGGAGGKGGVIGGSQSTQTAATSGGNLALGLAGGTSTAIGGGTAGTGTSVANVPNSGAPYLGGAGGAGGGFVNGVGDNGGNGGVPAVYYSGSPSGASSTTAILIASGGLTTNVNSGLAYGSGGYGPNGNGTYPVVTGNTPTYIQTTYGLIGGGGGGGGGAYTSTSGTFGNQNIIGGAAGGYGAGGGGGGASRSNSTQAAGGSGPGGAGSPGIVIVITY